MSDISTRKLRVIEKTKYPLLQQFRDKLKGGAMTEGIVEQIDLLTDKYGDEYTSLAERILAMLEKMGYDTLFICQQYIYDYLTQLRKFLKTGSYRQESFEEIKNSPSSKGEF